MIYIFDIDGTLADCTHRLHFIRRPFPDWPAFFAACVDDSPIPEVIKLLHIIAGEETIVLATGRSDKIRQQTYAWLITQKISAFTPVYMRKTGDHREDHIVKAELLDKIIHDFPGEEIGGVFEDRQQVVDMYRAQGLRVFQVAKGDY